MSPPERFSQEEERVLAQALRSGDELACPSCHVPLDDRRVPPRPDVAYVRDRIWLVCPSCRRTLVLDRRDPP